MNVAWAMLWGGSQSAKPCVFSCKVAAADDERYLLCAAVAAAVVLVPPLCLATSGCSCVCSSLRFLNLWLQIALEWLHECCMGYVVGRKPERETLCFSMYKWLQPTMKGTSCVRRLWLRSFWFLLCVLQQVVVPVCVVLCVSWISGCRSHWNGCMTVAWARLRPTMKGTSCVRRLRLRSFWFLLCVLQQVVVPVCVVLCISWISGCRSHWNGCMNVAWAMLWGGSRGTKPNLVFFRVRWLQRLHA